jgi:hypothetical protein
MYTKEYLAKVNEYHLALESVKKIVNIQINLEDLDNLKKSKYKLCFAKKVGDNDYNVVWQSSDKYLANNTFKWTPQYSLFGSNHFAANVAVDVSTNVVPIQLGETSILNSSGVLGNPKTHGPDTGFTLQNNYESIHPGVNQLSIDIEGNTSSTPIYVSEDPVVMGPTLLTPVEMVLVWFEQNIETSTMFSDSRSNSVEIDLTASNTQSRMYKDQQWITI